MDGQIKAIGESYSTKEARQKAFTTFKSLNSKGISINYYTNDDKVIDMNKNDVIVIDGILKKINTNLFNEIYSFSVYAD